MHLVFLICYPPTQQTTYLNFVATVAKLMRDDAHLKAMLKAKNDKEVLDVLHELSSPLSVPEELLCPQGKG